MTAFEEVAHQRITIGDLEGLQFDRLAIRYKEPLEWVKWILTAVSPSLKTGASKAPGLLLDMNVLFQSAIARRLQRATYRSNNGLNVEAQATGYALATIAGTSDRAFPLRPDLIIRHGSAVAAIADTKWKVVDTMASGHVRPASDDMYQMLAYSAAIRCPELVLIFPWHHRLGKPKTTLFELPEMHGWRPIVSSICVDVGVDAFTPLGEASPAFLSLLAA